MLAMCLSIFTTAAVGQISACDGPTINWTRCQPTIEAVAGSPGELVQSLPNRSRPSVQGTGARLYFDASATTASRDSSATVDAEVLFNGGPSGPEWSYSATLLAEQARRTIPGQSGYVESRVSFPLCNSRAGLTVPGPTRYELLLDGSLRAEDPARFTIDGNDAYIEGVIEQRFDVPRVSARIDVGELIERGEALQDGEPIPPIVVATGWINALASQQGTAVGLGFEAEVVTSGLPELPASGDRDFAELTGSVQLRLLSVRPGCSLADWDGSESIDVADFSAYLNGWSAAEPDADLTSAGTCDPAAIDGIIDMSDFACFLSQWAAGCP